MSMENKYDYVMAQLKSRLGNKQLLIVAKMSGVSRRTIGYMLKDRRDIRSSTLDLLYDYLKDNVRKKHL